MKSRITTYLLIVTALVVWGFVAWRIFFVHPAPTTPIASTTVKPKSVDGERHELRLDYEDPFLKNTTTEVSEPSDTEQLTAPIEPAAPLSLPLDDPNLKYAGTISAGGKVSYIFEISGFLHSLSVGETIDGYTLSEAFVDSVRLMKAGTVFTLHASR